MAPKVLMQRWFSDQGLTKKAYLNSITVLLDYGARFVVAFLLAPFLVRGLGDTLYGIWQVLSQMTGYLYMVNGRPNETLRMSLAKAQNDQDLTVKQQYVGSTIAVGLLYLPLFTLVGIVLVWYAPRWLDVAPEYVLMVRIATGLLSLRVAVHTMAAIPEAVLQGENLGYKRMGLTAALVLVGGGLMALAVLVGWQLVGLALAAVLTVLLSGLLYLKIVRDEVPWFGALRPTRALLRRYVGLSGWFLLWRLVLQLMLASDIVLLGIFGSVELVTVYTLTRNIPDMMATVVTNVVTGVAPGLGGVIGSAEYDKAAKLRGEIMTYSWLIATIVGALILLLNRSFVGLWVGAEYFAGPLPNLLILIMMVQSVLIRNDASIIDLTLDIRQKVIGGLVSLAVASGLAIALMEIYDLGIVGLLAGFIIGRLIMTAGYPLIIGRLLHIPLQNQLRGVIRPALTTVALFAIVYYAITLPPASNWLILILYGIGSALAVTLITFFAGLSATQRTSILERVQRVV